MASSGMVHRHLRSSASAIVGAGSPTLLRHKRKRRGSAAPCSRLQIRAETMATEGLEIKVERNTPESRLAELGVRQWPKWGCPPSKFPWTYSAKETCYLLMGKVKVYPDGSGDGDGYVEFGAGDLVVFPKGLSCTWDVSETVDKHYNFE